MNLLETIMGQLGGSTIDKIGSLLGEQSGGTKSAIGAAIPFLLSTIAKKATGSTSGAESIFGMVKDDNSGILNNIGDLLNSTEGREKVGNSGGGILSSLLGSQLGNIVSAVSGFSGLRSGSASSLLKMVAPMVISSLFKAKKSSGLNASGLANLLRGQADDFEKAIPSGFSNSLKSFGIGDLSGKVGATASSVSSGAGRLANATTGAVGSVGNSARNMATGAATTAGAAAVAGGSGIKKFLPWLLIAAIGLGALMLYKSCSSNQITTPKVNKITTPKVRTPKVKKPTLPKAPKVDLSKLGISLGSAEGKFANMLNNGKAKIGSNFILNKVEFNSGSSNIKTTSFGQLNSLIKIMKSYPRLKMRLEGHTDSSGDASRNLALSKQRADAVRKYLSTKGIAANRLSANGFGIVKPIADNKTREGRARNRRVEAVITGM